MITTQKLVAFLFLALAYSCHPVLAWGGRGHHSICEAAVFLVQEKGLADSLRQKPQMLGHLCNIPDTHWRNLGPEIGRQGNTAHYVDLEILGIPYKDIPTDYKKLVETYTGQKNAFDGKPILSVPLDFGSNWWRADQFYRRAIAIAPLIKEAPLPANSREEQNDEFPYNKAAYEFYINLGLMGHFVGDNGQPFHLTTDYDGYKAGHGGIHAYFEDTVVAALPYNLTAKVVEEGKKLQKLKASKSKADQKKVPFLTEKSVVEKMKALGLISFSEIQKVYALDPVKKPSVEKEEKGMSLKTPAERSAAETVSAKYEPLIVSQMARSATLLAQLWDEAYVEIGRPRLGSYKSYKFPFTPDFVPPDYFDLKLVEKKKDK